METFEKFCRLGLDVTEDLQVRSDSRVLECSCRAADAAAAAAARERGCVNAGQDVRCCRHLPLRVRRVVWLQAATLKLSL